jgi:hypothetical protein
MITVVDMSGKTIFSKECLLKQYASTPITLTLAKGTYLAKVEVNGVNTGNAKIIVP